MSTFAALALLARVTPNETGVIIIVGTIILVAIIAIVCIIDYVAKAAKARELDAAADACFRKWKADVASIGGRLPTYAVSIHLQKGEACYFRDTTAELYELRAVRDGRVGGASVRVMKGVTIHSGGFRSESHDEWRKIATGALYVTNKRIIFDGNMKNRILKLEDVMSIDPSYREACVNSNKLQKPFVFGEINGQIFATIVNSLCSN